MSEKTAKYYSDMQSYLSILEQRGKLIRVKRQVNKDTEIGPLRTSPVPWSS